MSRLLALDLDGTLANRAAAVWAWAQARGQPRLVALDRDGRTPREALFAALEEPYDRAAYARELSAHFPPSADGVQDRLAALRRDGWRLAMVTNGPAEMQRATIARLGLDPLVDAVCVSGELGVRKPDPRIFALAAERAGAPLAGGWMVGDSEDDVAGARNAGLCSVWLRRGRTWSATGLAPDRTAEDLPDALDQLSGAAGPNPERVITPQSRPPRP